MRADLRAPARACGTNADAGTALTAPDAIRADLPTVLVRARRCDPEAVEALADLVEARLLRAAPRSRGGDQRAAERAQRDAALRQLAALLGADMPRERLARDLAGRLKRFRPMPAETAPERVLMREIITSGLPVPGPDRLARILRTR